MTDKYKELLNKSEARLHEIAVHCERVERRLKDVNTAAMTLCVWIMTTMTVLIVIGLWSASCSGAMSGTRRCLRSETHE